MDDKKDLFIAWLKDAYAMEKSIEATLREHAKDAKDYPMVQEKISQHADTTRDQGEKLKELIENMDESIPRIKAVSGEIMGKIQSYAKKFKEDKVIKNTLMDIATEAFEISTYKSLILTAERLGDDHAKEVLESILAEEEEMSGWAEENLPMLMEEFFMQETYNDKDDVYENDEDDRI